jgi:hypothetical protein
MVDRLRRNGFEPAGFRPLEHPLYVALLDSDLQDGILMVYRSIPWARSRAYAKATAPKSGMA